MAWAVIVGVAAVLVVSLILWLGVLLQGVLTFVLTKALRVRSTVAGVDVSLLRGTLDIRGIQIANLPTFSQQSPLLRVARVSLVFPSFNLLSKPFRMSVAVHGIDASFEWTFKGSNLSALVDSLRSPSVEADPTPKPSTEPEPTPEPAKEKEDEKKEDAQQQQKQQKPSVLITRLEVVGSTVHVMTLTPAGTLSVPLPIPTIQLNDVGASSASSLLVDVLSSITSSITNVVNGGVGSAVNLFNKCVRS